MTKDERFTIIQDGDYFTVRDNLKNKHMGVFEFKEDEFPVYFCFHKIIDLLNELHEENVELHIQNDFLQCESKHLREVLQENRLLKSNIHTVINNYTRQLKRHTLYFEIMMDLARDLGVDVKKLEALDD